MANLRIVHNNAVPRALSLAATSTAGSLAITNILTDIKTDIWRSTAATAQDITITWTNAEMVKMCAVAFASLTTAATMRVRGYTNAGDAIGSPLFDTGTLSPFTAQGQYEWETVSALSSNLYGFGAGKTGALYFTGGSVKKLIVTLTDTTNPNGYIELANIICGNYWEPTLNCEYGVNLTAQESTKHERDDAGNLRVDRGPKWKSITVDCTLMPAADRDVLWRIMHGNGMTKPVFFSLNPGATDVNEEAQYQLYGKLSRVSALKYQFYNQFNSTLDIEEI